MESLLAFKKSVIGTSFMLKRHKPVMLDCIWMLKCLSILVSFVESVIFSIVSLMSQFLNEERFYYSLTS